MRRWAGIRIFAFAMALVSGLGLSAQEAGDVGVDQLFDEPQADIDAQAGDQGQPLQAFHAQPLTLSGSLTAVAGGVVGFVDQPSGYAFRMTPGISIVPSLTFVSRPDETIRIQGTVTFASLSFAPVVSEMFFDYTLRNLVYLRAGMHTVSWGVTRFFDGGGDLMAGSGSGLDIRAAVPIGPGGATVVALVPLQANIAGLSWRNLTYGAQADIPVGRSEILIAGTYLDSAATPLKATAVFKTSLFGVDLFAEAIEAWTRAAGFTTPSVVGGFYWEQPQPELKLYGEYYFNAADSGLADHRVVLALGMDRAFGSPFNLGLEWIHAFMDNSGIVIPGVSFDLWPHVTAQVGLPVRYGSPGSFYLANPPPTIATTTSVNDILSTWSQRYAIMFRLTLSTGF